MAITERYVSSTGTDTYANSTNPVTPMSLTTAFANAAAGDRINIKAGTYTRTATDNPTNSGSATSPIVWRGYVGTIGDATLARSSGGALNVSNMPTIAYNSTFKLGTAAKSYHIFEALNITGAVSDYLVHLEASGLYCDVVNCKVSNTSTNAAAAGIGVVGAGCLAINCDVSIGASGGNCGIECSGGSTGIIGCRVTSSAVGIKCSTTSSVVNNTIFSCGTDGIQMNVSGSTPLILNNTVQGCAGDGIDIISTAINGQRIIGNHLTDNGGYGINFNGAACGRLVAFNRYRDNTSGATSGGDWVTGTDIRNVTVDTGGASTDYTNAGSDFSLIAGAPGISGGIGYLIDIGANGSPIVAAGGLLTHPGMAGGMRA